MRFEEWRVDDSKLDNDQRIIVFGGNLNGRTLSIKDNFVVQGSAGSGKTIMAVRKSIIFGSLPNWFKRPRLNPSKYRCWYSHSSRRCCEFSSNNSCESNQMNNFTCN